jgi:Tat protein secretion system quality control protein TatD with DNase activity
LALAAELGRAVSVHGVQAHGLVYEALAETWAGCEKVVLSKRERKRRGADHPSVEAQTADESELSSAQSTHDSRPDEKQKHNPAPYPPRVCLHSYSGNPANFKLYTNPAIPVRIFASFSTAINLGDMVDGETPAAFVDMVRAVPDDMVLVESDLHTAGDEMDRRLEDIVRRICEIKGWELEEGVRILGRNWKTFVFGDE